MYQKVDINIKFMYMHACVCVCVGVDVCVEFCVSSLGCHLMVSLGMNRVLLL